MDQKSTCTAPGGGVKETKQYFEEEGDQINLGGLGPLFNNGTGDTEDREDWEDDRPSSDSSSSNVSSLVIVKARYRATSHRADIIYSNIIANGIYAKTIGTSYVLQDNDYDYKTDHFFFQITT